MKKTQNNFSATLMTSFVLAAFILATSFTITSSASAATITNKAPSKATPKVLHTATSTPKKIATSTQDKSPSNIVKKQERATDMINNRLVGLGVLIGRVQNTKKISDSDKAAIIVSIRDVVASLITLRGTISTTTSTTTLKNEMDSITKSYRVFALVEPQANILAAAGRIQYIATSLNSVYAKINTRLASTTYSSSVNQSISTAISSFRSKINDANQLASTSIALVGALKPDNGDKTLAASNKAALKDARSKITTAQKDLNDAQKFLRTAFDELGKINSKNNAK